MRKYKIKENMRKFPTWSEFEYKYPTEAERRDRLEDLARCLFCKRFNMKYGIYQSINQTGNETDVIELDGEVIGFQSKYFEKKINKAKIVDSIQKAKRENPTQTKIIIYMNLSFGTATKKNVAVKGKNAPKSEESQLKKDIEKEAQRVGLKIEWTTDKMILQQVVQESWIQDVFFTVESDYETLYNSEKNHLKNVLNPIKSAIVYQDKPIKIPREQIITQIKDGIYKGTKYVIYGEGGCGKTAVIKDLCAQLQVEDIPICIRKAQALNVRKVDDLFAAQKNFTIEQFMALYSDALYKVFVIDSAERLQEIDDTEPVYNLLERLQEEGWSVLFTVRNQYMGELSEELQRIYHIPHETIRIDTISEEELEQYAKKLQITLPESDDFKRRLCNLFDLKYYLYYYPSIQQKESYQEFIKQIWKMRIAGKGASGIAREKCFVRIVIDRMNKSDFYLDKYDYDAEPLQALIKDEIIEDTDNGIFITHDIYEEWGILRVIEKEWTRKANIADFFNKIGSSYVTRRTFRQWLSDRLNRKLVYEIQDLFHASMDDSVPIIWRDEIIVSILQSVYSDAFFEESKELLTQNNSKLLERVAYLLIVACTRISDLSKAQGSDTIIYVPEGHGWKVMIRFIYNNRESETRIPYRLKILYDWTIANPYGETTHLAGLTAMETMVKYEKNGNRWYAYHRDRDTLYSIISFAARTIKTELTQLLEEIVAKGWYKHNAPYYEFSLFILTEHLKASNLVITIPRSVIALADMMWIGNGEKYRDDSYAMDINQEQRFGLHHPDALHSYFPAGAKQTPIYWLLRIAPLDTMQFIVQLVNHCVETYAKASVNDESALRLEQIELHFPDGTIVKQWGSYWLWDIYRGEIHYSVPHLLESVHMALEEYLLAEIKENPKNVEQICEYILKNSKSISLTAIVASIVMADPERYYKHALVLFSSLELFHYDSIRQQGEGMRQWQVGMAASLNYEIAKERNQSNQFPHRNKSLEEICTNYQYFRSALSEEESQTLLEQIREVLDKHWETVNQVKGTRADTKKILLYRMDRRTHKPKVEGEKDGQIMFNLNPQMPEDLRQRSDEFIEETKASMRFSLLHIWAHKRLRHEDVSQYSQYENDVTKVTSALRDLLNAIKEKEELMPFDEWIPYSVSGVLVRDFYKHLTDEDKELCIGLICDRLVEALSPSYYPQIDDGVECCVHALPRLIETSDKKDKEACWKVLLRILQNKVPLGEYKRVCDYAIETVHEGHLWKNYPQETRELLKRSVEMSASEKINKHRVNIEFENAEFVLSMIPMNTMDEDLEQMVQQQLPVISKLLADDPGNVYYRMVHLYSAFAHFILNRPIDKITLYINPLCFGAIPNREWQYFLIALISTENILRKPKAFWKVWELLYPKLVTEPKGYDDDVLATYLLSGKFALLDRENGCSFDASYRWLYSKSAIDKGHLPIVLFSIAKAMNDVAQSFVRDGIDWVYTIVTNHSGIEMKNLQVSSNLYLQYVLNAYVKHNRKEIRKDNALRNKLLTILTFMAERESVFAYKLRERL